MNMKTNIREEDIVLAPQTEIFDEAKEIAHNTGADEKFPFFLQYDANQKDFLLSVLQTVGAIVENDDEEGHMLSTRMNMTQLAFIKRLDCVERVRTHEGRNTMLAAEATKANTVDHSATEATATHQATQVVTLAVEESGDTAHQAAVASAGVAVASSSCCCPSNTSMATAQTIAVQPDIAAILNMIRLKNTTLSRLNVLFITILHLTMISQSVTITVNGKALGGRNSAALC